jgi:hypothetical protein
MRGTGRKGHRNNFTQAANGRARETDVEALVVAVAEQSEDSTADGFVDCEDCAGPKAVGTENHAASGHVDEEPALDLE